jgi:hypothetical protein
MPVPVLEASRLPVTNKVIAYLSAKTGTIAAIFSTDH